MKKLTLLSMITAVSLMANEYGSLQEIETSQAYEENVQERLNDKSLESSKETPYVFLKVADYDVDFNNKFSDSAINVNLGLGADSIRDNGMLVGVRGFIGLGDINDINMIDLGIEGKFGYAWTDSFNSYLIAGWKYTNIDGKGYESVAAYGFGGGVGTEFRFTEHFGVAAEYTYYHMDPDSTYGTQPITLDNYDNQNIGLQINYYF